MTSKSKKDKRKKGDKESDPKRKATTTSRVSDDGSAEIAKAEKRLAKALRGVEEARQKLAVRERELTTLLAKHGRLPSVSDSPAGDQSTVQLFDQAQVVDLTDDGDVSSGELEVVATSSDAADESDQMVQLFDQKQVVH